MKPSYLQDQIIRGLLMSEIIEIDGDQNVFYINTDEKNLSCFNYIKELISDESNTIKMTKEYKKEFLDKENNFCLTKSSLDKIDLFGLYVWYIGTLETLGNKYLYFPNVRNNETLVLQNIIKLLKKKFNLKVNISRRYSGDHLELDDWMELFLLIYKFIPKEIRKELMDSKLVYLAGPMEYSEGEGLEWRREFATKLSKLGYKSIVPNDEEKLIKEKYDISINSKKNNIEEYIAGIREFIILDLTFVEATDFIVCKWEGERFSGTAHEVGYARQLGTPSYLITTQSIDTVPSWFLACFTKYFKTIDELIRYLEEKDYK